MKSKMLIFGCAAALLLLTGCNTLTPPLSVAEGGRVATMSVGSTTAADTTVTTTTDGTTDVVVTTAENNSTTARRTAISTTAKATVATTTKKQTTSTTAVTTKKSAVSTTKKPIITTVKTAITAKPTTAAPIDIAAVQQEVFRLVNEQRAKAGLSALTYCYAAQSAADIRAQEITQSFSHTRPNGTSCFTVLEGMDLTYWAVGENIAMGYTSPSAVMDGWMNSEGHRENILNSNFNAIVIGFKDNHWVQLFLKL